MGQLQAMSSRWNGLLSSPSSRGSHVPEGTRARMKTGCVPSTPLSIAMTRGGGAAVGIPRSGGVPWLGAPRGPELGMEGGWGGASPRHPEGSELASDEGSHAPAWGYVRSLRRDVTEAGCRWPFGMAEGL